MRQEWLEERENKGEGKTGRRKEWAIKWKLGRPHGSYGLATEIWVAAGIL